MTPAQRVAPSRGAPAKIGSLLAEALAPRASQPAAVYAAPYDALMEKAGYFSPSEGSAAGRHRRLAAFAIDDLTAEEEELLKYLAFIRSRTRS